MNIFILFYFIVFNIDASNNAIPIISEPTHESNVQLTKLTHESNVQLTKFFEQLEHNQENKNFFENLKEKIENLISLKTSIVFFTLTCACLLILSVSMNNIQYPFVFPFKYGPSLFFFLVHIYKFIKRDFDYLFILNFIIYVTFSLHSIYRVDFPRG